MLPKIAAMPTAPPDTNDAGAAPGMSGALEPDAPASPKPVAGRLLVPDAVGATVEDMEEDREALPR